MSGEAALPAKQALRRHRAWT